MGTLLRFQQAKHAIVDQFQSTDTLLHIHAGMAIYVATRVLLGRHRSPLIAWAVVATVEAANEVADRLTYGSWRSANTTSDVLQTLFWPTALMLTRLLDRRRRRRC